MNRLLSGRVVSKEAWVDQNYEYLWHIYRIIQEMNDSSGRRVFDRERCDFTSWCDVAYAHSSLYTSQEEWMYEEDDEDEDYHGVDNWDAAAADAFRT
jgi:DNA phosphorothioation-dependent restriction protein DptG